MRMKIKRRGSCFDDILKNRLRYSLTLGTRDHSREALFVLKDFLLASCGNLQLREDSVKLMNNMIFMQTRIKNKLETKFPKIEVLLTFWDKMVGIIQKQAFNLKDDETLKMIGLIIQVPMDVKKAVLKTYLIKCVQMYAIAFM